MKFVKHFTDAHRGTLVQSLMDEFGLAGVGFYWTLVEMCGEKLEKELGEEFANEHCIFHFNERLLRNALRISSANVERMLNHCQTMVALSWTFVGNEIKIEMPKLLECLDRDSKRARHGRAVPAPKIKKKIKIKNNTEPKPDGFDEIYKLYPRKEGKTLGRQRYDRDIKTEYDHGILRTSAENYVAHCRRQRLDPKYIMQFGTFMGCWRDWLEADAGKVILRSPIPPAIEPKPPATEWPTGKDQALSGKSAVEIFKSKIKTGIDTL